MQNSITWVGMDVHAENIVLAAVLGSTDAVFLRAEFPNTPKGRERLAGRLAENASVPRGQGHRMRRRRPRTHSQKTRRPRQDRPQGR